MAQAISNNEATNIPPVLKSVHLPQKMEEAIVNDQISDLNLDLERLKLTDTTPQPNTGKGNNAPCLADEVNTKKSWKESEENAGAKSNNAPIPRVDNNEKIVLGPDAIGILMEECRSLTETEIREAKREEEKRKKVLDANNFGDPQNIARVRESAVYRTIATEPFRFHKPSDMKCCQVRWLYYDSKKKLHIPLKGKDSQLIEIKHRQRNGMALDHEAQRIYEEYLVDYNFEKALDSTDGKVRLTEQRSTDTEDESDASPKPLVLNGLYKVNKKNSRIYSVYWGNESMKLVRGTYFKFNGQPIGEELAKNIEIHLDRFYDEKYRMEGSVKHVESEKLSIPSPLHTHGNLIKWSPTFEQPTIQGRGQNPTRLVRYHELANWTDDYPKTEHLVFVVHGVGHNGKGKAVVKCAKLLTDGVDNADRKNSGILFLPIHWRSLIKNEPTSPCENDLVHDFHPLINFFLNDVKLYNSRNHGPKIRQIVIEKIRDIFKKFKVNNPEFTGTVSLFGHSLGSVICYDILTMKSLECERKSLGFKVDRLFAVGSPLKEFLEKRGGPFSEEFLQAAHSTRIYNVFHPRDLVSRRLEPFVNDMYQVADSLEIPTSVASNWSFKLLKLVGSVVWNPIRWTWTKCSAARMRRGRSLRQELPYRIDYQLQVSETKNDRWDELQPHSIYSSHVGLAFFILNILRNENELVLRRENFSAESENVEEEDKKEFKMQEQLFDKVKINPKAVSSTIS
ncbi:hypothetical protein CRE_21533 [Caenorhabditis remanei]|uniref:DDHD domain-containing protein n=1 Tax=Caenorhabditis remanei TaxID=31234 RepID=E3NCQ1_CAERE|nr:hypothetical protein CRE_21533 [Caenorhabditis remanei]